MHIDRRCSTRSQTYRFSKDAGREVLVRFGRDTEGRCSMCFGLLSKGVSETGEVGTVASSK